MNSDRNSFPLFSVIIPTYNREHFLDAAISSVLDQTYDDFELIVVDDGSVDGTKQLVDKYKSRRVSYIYQNNQGVSSARNSGIKKARGEYIAFLDSDDRWVSEKLERTVEYISQYPEVYFFHTEEDWYKNGRFFPQKKKHKKPSGFVYQSMLPICCVSMSTAVVRRELIEDIGVFDEELIACEDYDFILRAAAQYQIELIPEYLTIKDGGRQDQLSFSIWGLDRFRIKALVKMLYSGVLSKEDFIATENALKEKCLIYAKGASKRGKYGEANFYKQMINKEYIL